MPGNKPRIKKQTYLISREITEEEILAKKDILTASMLHTNDYLNRLEMAPNMCDLPPYCFMKFKG